MSFRRGGGGPAPLIQLPDGSVVRGAKKGGITDHIAGPHLIPNVGREAMVPGEVVSRRARPKPKPKAAPPKAPALAPVQATGKKKKHKDRSPQPRRRTPSPASSHSRSQSREKGQGRGPDRQSRRDQSSPSPRAHHTPGHAASSTAPGDARAYDPEATTTTEHQVRQDEANQLRVLEEARQNRIKLEEQRRKNLGGAFALTEDDIDAENDEDAQRKAAAREKARVDEKRPVREKLSLAEIRQEAPTMTSSSASAGPPRLLNKDSVTALDIDGSLHEHKFSKTWKDWDASKRDDPGEIARMFMKVSAVKRRGYGTTPGGSRRAGSRSRSRSRSRRR